MEIYLLLIVFAVFAIGVSFFCSIAEAVLLSVTPSYVASLQKKSPRAATILEALKSNIDRPLSAILSLNTIAHTVGAAGVGAEAAKIWDARAVGWASAIMTLLILVLSEIIPKTIGAVYWRELAPLFSRLLGWLILILLPLVWVSELITQAISGGKGNEVVTRDEVAAMAHLSAEGGQLEENESRILHNLFRLRDLRVQDIMTPRTVIVAFPEEKTVAEITAEYPELPVSRVPIYDGEIDRVTGFVLRADIFGAEARDEHETQLKELRRDIKTIAAERSLAALFDLLIHQREHIAIVVDEYGGTDGLVTMEDLIETLLGLEIVDEHDSNIDMQKFARRQWERRAKNLANRSEQPPESNPS